MNKNINTQNGKVGLPEEVYTLNPAKALILRIHIR